MSTYLRYVPNRQYYIHIENLPINTSNILGQRHCDPKEITQALSVRGGFDMGLYRPVFCIAVAKEIANKWVETLPKKKQARFDNSFKHGLDKALGKGNLNDYALFLFDGKHRSEQLKAVDPMVKTFPGACIYFVDDVYEGNKLFNEFNERSLTKVSPEVLFINDWLANLLKPMLVDRLSDVNVAICDKKDSITVPEKAETDVSIPSITANPWKLFNRADWHPEWKYVAQAFELYHAMLGKSKVYASMKKQAFEDGEKMKRIEINSWIIHGLATLLRLRPAIMDKPQPREAFVDVLAESYDYYKGKQSAMIKGLRTDAIGTHLGKEAKDLNSCKVWAVVFASGLNTHGDKHGVRKRDCQDATKTDTLWDDITASEDAIKLAKAKAKMKKVA